MNIVPCVAVWIGMAGPPVGRVPSLLKQDVVVSGCVDDHLADRNSKGYVAVEGRTYVHVPGIPFPVTCQDMTRWSDVLMLSVDQRNSADRFFEEYRAAERRCHEAHVQPLWNRVAELFETGGRSMTTSFARGMIDVFEQDRPKAVQRIAAVEAEFFNRLGSILSDEQLVRLEHVRAERSRQHQAMVAGRLPGVNVDLFAFVGEWAIQRGEWPLSNPAGFWEAISEYDRRALPLLQARTKALIENMGQGALIQAETSTPGARWNPERGVQLKALHNRLIDVERRLHDLNVLMFARMLDAVTVGAKSSLRDAFERNVYPNIFPDPTDIGDALRLIKEGVATDDRTQRDIVRLVEDADARRVAICEMMKDRYVEWRDDNGRQWPARPEKRAEFLQQMKSFHNLRLNLMRQTIRAISDALGEEIPERVAKRLSAIASRAESHLFEPDHRSPERR